MKIVIDDKIPYIREAISRITDDAVYKKGAEINAQDVKDADALIVRTRTRCDEQLLRGSKVSFVATATIGYDHIDTAYMQQAGIRWMNCPGCNASSVAQYVGAVLALLQRDKGITLNQSTIGVVGCGHVGAKVAQVARREGMKVLLCDPPRAEREGQGHFVDLPTIAREADIITFHVPLTREGNHTTWHLADQAFFNSLQRRPVVINSSRGAVVDNHALLHALIYNKVREAVVDTWENEPRLLLPLLQRVWIGTPHIAGYSADGKVNADNMVVEALCRHFNLPCPIPSHPVPTRTHACCNITTHLQTAKNSSNTPKPLNSSEANIPCGERSKTPILGKKHAQFGTDCAIMGVFSTKIFAHVIKNSFLCTDF